MIDARKIRDRRERRRTAFRRVAELRKELGDFDLVVAHLQREHARVYDAIDLLRRMGDDLRNTLGKAVDALDELPL